MTLVAYAENKKGMFHYYLESRNDGVAIVEEGTHGKRRTVNYGYAGPREAMAALRQIAKDGGLNLKIVQG